MNVVEGERKRVQAYEGVVIAKRNRGLNSSFIVRKISSGEGVERTFQTYSPLIASIDVKRRGDVGRAKLYYLRQRSGKAARIKEKLEVHVAVAEPSPEVGAAVSVTGNEKAAVGPLFFRLRPRLEDDGRTIAGDETRPAPDRGRCEPGCIHFCHRRACRCSRR